jgi:MFS family permease
MSKIDSTSSRMAGSAAVVVVVGLATFLGAMGFSVVAVALPELGRALELSIEDTSWVMLSFLMAATAFMLPAGQAGDLFGLKRIYLTGFVIVGLSMLLAGTADSLSVIVIGRVFHGLGGAMVMAAAPAILTTHTSPARRGAVLGIVATATYAGLTVGPAVGSILTSQLGWRWAFLFLVPISMVVVPVGWYLLPRDRIRVAGKMDWTGALLLLIFVPMLFVVPGMAGRWGWQPWMAASLSGAGLVGIVFVMVELRIKQPLLTLSLFRSGLFTGAVISAVCNYAALFLIILLVPFMLEEGLAYPTALTGYILAAQPLFMALVSTPSGRLSDRIGTRIPAVAGLLIMSAGLGVLTAAGSLPILVLIILGLVLVGAGTGVFISPNSSALMGSASDHQQGRAAAVLAMARNLGMLLGTAIGAGVFALSGGKTGSVWGAVDFSAFSMTMAVGVVIGLIGAATASLRK